MAVFVSAIAVAATELSVAAIATAVMQTGVAMQVVGAVTGNESLMKIGGYMSMAGGIGSLVNAGINAASTAASEAATKAATDAAVDEATKETTKKLAEEATRDLAADAALDMAADGAAGQISDAAIMSTLPSPAQTSIASPGLLESAAAEPSILGDTSSSLFGDTTAALNSATQFGQATNVNSAAGGIGSQASSQAADAAKQKLAGEMAKGSGKFSEWWSKLAEKDRVEYLKLGGMVATGIGNALNQGKMQEEDQRRYDQQYKNANSIPKITFSRPMGLVASGKV